MNTNELKDKARRKLEQLSEQIETIKDKKPKNPDVKAEMERLIYRMEEIRDNVKNIYSENLKNVESGKKVHWDEFEKNIFQDLKSFDNAFSKAGTFFRPGNEVEK